MGTQTKHPLLCTPSSLRLSSPLASCCRCWATLGRPSPCLLAGPQAGDEAGLPALGSRADAPGVTGGCRPLAPSRAGSRHCPQTWTLSKQGGGGAGMKKQEVGTPNCCLPDQGAPARPTSGPPAPIGRDQWSETTAAESEGRGCESCSDLPWPPAAPSGRRRLPAPPPHPASGASARPPGAFPAASLRCIPEAGARVRGAAAGAGTVPWV